MLKHINIRKISALLIMVLVLLTNVAMIQAADEGEIPNQLTVIYNTADHDLDQLSIDSTLISNVEHISDKVDVLTLKNSADGEAIKAILKKSDKVVAADFEAIAQTDSIPNDKFYEKYQSYMKDMGYENIEPGSNQVKVAVMDTGVNDDHEDLLGRVELSGYNYVDSNDNTKDQEGHGTEVSGVIAANTNNEIGIAGTVGNANVLVVPYVVLGANGEGKLSGIAACLEDISKRDDIDIVNLSLGFDSENEVLKNLCDKLSREGKIVVASSGNYGGSELLYPAGYDSVISVGAVNADLKRCTSEDWGEGNGSNYGPGLDIMASGDNIAVPDITGGYVQSAGTSFSAPFVSGACALALTRDKSITTKDILDKLATTSKDLETPGYDLETGYGLVQFDKLSQAFPNKTEVKATGLDVISSPVINLELVNNPLAQISVNVIPADTTDTLSFESDNPDVATVDENGLVTAHKEGSANIIIKVGSLSESVSINVQENKPEPEEKTVKVYRLYNEELKEHLYTTNYNEVRTLTNGNGWKSEDIGWEAPETGTPVYRLYSPVTHYHLYTTDENEVKVLTTQAGWQIDFNGKPLFYSGGNKPVYRLYNQDLKVHHLTTDRNEYETLGKNGWDQENVALHAAR